MIEFNRGQPHTATTAKQDIVYPILTDQNGKKFSPDAPGVTDFSQMDKTTKYIVTALIQGAPHITISDRTFTQGDIKRFGIKS